MTFRAIPITRAWTGPRGGTLKVVVVDAAYDTLDHPLTQALLPKVMAMKIAGYGKEFPYGALPVDVGDIIGVHLLVCEEWGGKLEPLMGLKSVSGRRCEIHRIEFPALHLACPHELPRHHAAVRTAMDDILKKRERFAYSCSWTMAPIARQDRELAKLLKHINMAFFVFYYQDYNIPHIFAGATLRFKVDEWKSFLGFEPMEFEGSVLPDFPCTSFFGEPVRLMYLSRFTSEALELAKTFRSLWDQRITLDGDSVRAGSLGPADAA